MFFPVEHIHNTHNGELIGHTRAGEDPEPKEVVSNLIYDPYQSADNGNDKTYSQLQGKLANYIQLINGPEELVMLEQQWKPRIIFDEDGDGIEDNRHDTHDELDKFYLPAVFGVAEDLHNTHHGNLPGHIQREFEEREVEPKDTYTIIKDDWVRF